MQKVSGYKIIFRDIFETTIRRKMVGVAVLLLTIYSIFSFYMMVELSRYEKNHHYAKNAIEILDRIHGILYNVHYMDSLFWQKQYEEPELEVVNLQIRSSLHSLTIQTVENPVLKRKVDEIFKEYDIWSQLILAKKKPKVEVFKKVITTIEYVQDNIRNEIAYNDQKIKSRAQATRIIITSITTFYFFITLGLMSALWLAIAPKLRELIQAVQIIHSGDYSYQIKGAILRSKDEFGILASTFNEMTAALTDQNEKMKAMNQMKTDFVSMVSHELRTPLTAIKGGIGLVLGEVTGPITPETKEVLNLSSKNVDRLSRLINDILDISKIEAGALKLHLEKTEASAVIEQAISSLATFAKAHHISVTYKNKDALSCPILVSDKDRLEQIFINLISNAIKFSPENSNVDVEYLEKDDYVVFCVSDQGPGIPEDKFERLFKKFSQIHRIVNKPHEGTGLGLTICKALVEEHGGRIWVENIDGHGSRFYFSIPWNGKDRAVTTNLKAA